MIDIKDISGKIIKSVLITQECKEFDALMELCYIELSWSDTEGISLPAGSSIEWNGKLYSLLEPYFPDIHNEAEYKYSPKFYDDIASWSKQPFFLVTENGEETDWSLTAYPGQFLDAVVRALKKYVGKTYTYSIDASIAESRMENIVFQNSSIFEGLTKIADTWETEWWVEGDIIHISKCQYGNPVTLEVGYNIGVPTITKNKEGYYTRFYAFGSTRNITQDYNDSGFTNGIVNKRLTLNTSKYPGGYIDIRPNLKSGEIFVKTLIFEDIYPSSELIISGTRGVVKDLLDSEGNKIQIGTDSEGNPIYDKYTVWFFKIAGFNFNNSTYDPVKNPNGMLISGLDLSVHFESGQLNSRDFKLTYHEDTKEYEINFVNEGALIVPGTVSLIPTDGDKIILYNIKMPEEHTVSAQIRLAEALDAEINKRREDRDSYTFPSYPVVFGENNTNLNVGQSVTYKNGTKTLNTRVLKVEKQLDYPIEQLITIGEEKIKSTTHELKEEVVNANQSIDAVKALSDLNKAITAGYGRVQQAIIESISKYQGLWLLDKNGYPNNPDNWLVRTDYSVLGKKDIVAYATSDHDIVLPHAGYNMVGAVQIKPDSGLIIDSATGLLSVDPDYAGGGGGIDFTTGSGIQLSAQKVLSVKYGVAADTVAAGNDSRIINGQKAFEVISKGTWWGQKMNAEGVVTGAMTGVTNINGKLSFVDTGVDVTDNIRATGDVVAYATAPGDISDWLGLVIDNDTIRFNSAGKLYVAGGAGQAGIAGISVTGSGNAITSVALSADKTSLTFTKGSTFALKSEIPSSLKNPYSLTWSGYSSGSYDGSSAKTISIPSNTSQLTNGAGFITGINQTMILNALTGSGNSSKYLAGNGTFYSVGFNELTGVPSWISNWDTNRFSLNSNGGAMFKSSGAMFTPTHSDSVSPSIGVEIYNNQIRGVNSGASSNYYVSNLYLNYVNSSKYVKVDGDANISATGDVVAYATGSAPSPFKYWKPTVSSAGVISWENSTNESVPSSVNIKGPAGATGPQGKTGQGTTYQWSGTSLRIGTIAAGNGATTWGSYVNLKGETGARGATGPQGPAGPSGSWNGGTVTNLATFTNNASSRDNSGTLFVKDNTETQIWGNTINSWSRSSTARPRLWINYYKRTGWSYQSELFIGNGDGVGTQIVTINADGNGKLLTKNGTGTLSDSRLKCVFGKVENILDKIKDINVYEYTRNDDEDKILRTGVIAQEIAKVFPNIASKNFTNETENELYYTVDYATLGAIVSIQGCKELHAEIHTLKNRIQVLEETIKKLSA